MNPVQLTEPVEQAGGRHEVLRVPAMTRPFGDDDAASAVAQQGFSRCRDHGRVGVDHAVRKELHQVRLEQDALAANLHLQQLQPLADDLDQVGVVSIGRQDGHLRRRRVSKSRGIIFRCPPGQHAGQRRDGAGDQEIAA